MRAKTHAWLFVGLIAVLFVGFSLPAVAGEPIRVGVYNAKLFAEKGVEPSGIKAVLEDADGITPEYFGNFNRDTLDKFDVIIVWQAKMANDPPVWSGLPKDASWLDAVREWVREGHGLLVTHDGVGYRRYDPPFSDLAVGTGNAYANNDPYSIECCVSARHPLTEGMDVKSRFPLSYYDYIMIDPGAGADVVVRGVQKSGDGAYSAAPVVVCGSVGKGRFVANGALLGRVAPDAAPVRPIGGELQLLLNSVRYLAGSGPVEPDRKGGDIGQGLYLGPSDTDLAINGGCEASDSNGNPEGWKATLEGKPVALRVGTDALNGTGALSVAVPSGKEALVVNTGADATPGMHAYPALPETAFQPMVSVKASENIEVIPVMLMYGKDGDEESVREVRYEKSTKGTAGWTRVSGEFVPENTESFSVGVVLKNSGKDEEICLLDDLVLNKNYSKGLKGISVQSVLAGCEEKVSVDWKDTMNRPAPALDELAIGTPIEVSEKEMTLPNYDPIPPGWLSMDLSGEWKIMKLDDTDDNPEKDRGTIAGFWKPDFDDSDWKTRPVPSCWENEDKPYPDGFVGYGSYRTDFAGVGWYRYTFDVPADFKDGNAFIRFEAADRIARVYLNGKLLGDHEGMAPFEFNVTDVIEPGAKNVLAVRLFDGPVSSGVHGRTGTGGLRGKVRLESRPDVYASRLFIVPRIDKSLVEVEAVFTNITGKTVSIEIESVIEPSHAAQVLFPKQGRKTETKADKFKIKPGATTVKFNAEIKNPVLWSDTHPFLYTLYLNSGKECIAKERFGFREFKAEGFCFLLNGKRVTLRGIVFNNRNFRGYKALVNDNVNNAVRRLLLVYKGMNMNTVLPQHLPMPRLFYDICDEIGMLVYDLPAGDIPYKHNHPSLVMTAIAAETRHPSWENMGTKAYERVKSQDRQNRPVCTISGGRPSALTPKTDVEDCHAYPGDINGHPFDLYDTICRYNEDIWRHYGRVMPVVNYEMGGSRHAIVPDELKIGRKLFAEQMDKTELIRTLEGVDAAYRMPLGLRWLSMYGMRRYLVDDYDWAEQMHAEDKLLGRRKNYYWGVEIPRTRWSMKGQMESGRRLGDLFQGYGLNWKPSTALASRADKDSPESNYDARDLVSGELLVDAAYGVCKRCNNPEFVCLDFYDRNVFGGGEFAPSIYAINDTGQEQPPWSIRTVIKDKAGKRLADKTATIGKVEPGKRKLVAFSWNVPEELSTDLYRIDLFLLENDKPVSDNSYGFFVMNGNDLDRRIPVGKRKVALYDVSEKRMPAGTITTRHVMDELKMPYTRIENFDSLDEFDVLIIGANSCDAVVDEAGDRIADWLADGGRILQFEQKIPGRIGYIPQMNIVKKYGGAVADLIVPDHPAFDRIRHVENWEIWSGTLPDVTAFGRLGGIYSALIGPLNQTVLATGVLAVPRATDKAVQMLVSEAKAGEGVALVSQAEATRRYNTDSVATKYVQNLLKHVVSDEEKYAMPLSNFVVSFVDYRRCGYVDLEAYADYDLGSAEIGWVRSMLNGVSECGEVRFNLLGNGVLASKDLAMDLAKHMKLMAPNWEEQKRKYDWDQMGLQLTRPECIYILHTAPGGAKKEIIGKYVFVFKDGSKDEVPVIVGRNIGPREKEVKLDNGKYVGNGFYVTRWMNPFPEKDLASMKVVVESETAKLCIGGLTGYLTRERVHD